MTSIVSPPFWTPTDVARPVATFPSQQLWRRCPISPGQSTEVVGADPSLTELGAKCWTASHRFGIFLFVK